MTLNPNEAPSDIFKATFSENPYWHSCCECKKLFTGPKGSVACDKCVAEKALINARRCRLHTDSGHSYGPVAGCHECAAEFGLRNPVETKASPDLLNAATHEQSKPVVTYSLDGEKWTSERPPFGKLFYKREVNTPDTVNISAELFKALRAEIKALRKAWTEAESDNNILRAEIENTRADPVRKVKLPEGREIARTYMGVRQPGTVYFRKDDVLKALKAAGIEVEQ